MVGYVLFSCLMVAAISGETYKDVNVRDTTLSSEKHPDELTLTVRDITDESPLTLRLRRSKIVADIPFYTTENGRLKREVTRHAEDVALYQDKRHLASVAVHSVRSGDSQRYKRSLTGTFLLNGAEYHISPAKRSTADSAASTGSDGVDLPSIVQPEPRDANDGSSTDDEEQLVDVKRGAGDSSGSEEPLLIDSKRDVSHTLTRRELVRPTVNDHAGVPLAPKLAILDKKRRRRAVKFQKREAGKKTFGIEMLIGLDYSIYKRFDGNKDKMHQYFSLMIDGVDMRYDSIDDSELGIFVRIAGIVLAESADQYPWTDGHVKNGGSRPMVDASEALERIYTWDSTQTSPEHDHLMIFTDYDIYTVGSQGDTQSAVAGLAYSKTTCGSRSQSITEDHGGLLNIGVAAHELGHSLGAHYHDGAPGGDGSACLADDQNIMTAISGGATKENAQNPFRFSTCSIAQFKKYLITNENGAKCLSENIDHTTDIDFQKHVQIPPGQIWNVDAQCKMIFPGSGYYCGGPDNDEKLCYGLFCYSPEAGGCVNKGPAMRGTTCGNKKWCLHGACVANDAAPTVEDETCMSGDYKAPFQDGSTCAVKGTDKNFCRAGENAQICCGSCNKLKTNIEGCMWGDTATGCTKDYCAYEQFKQFCCETCAGT